MTTIRLDIKNLQWRAEMDARTGVWVAACEPLRQAVQADSWAELCATMNEAMNELFLDLLEDGELDAFLRANGWQQNMSIPPQVPPEGLTFDVPADFIRGPLRATA